MDENYMQALQRWTETTSTAGPTVEVCFCKVCSNGKHLFSLRNGGNLGKESNA